MGCSPGVAERQVTACMLLALQAAEPLPLCLPLLVRVSSFIIFLFLVMAFSFPCNEVPCEASLVVMNQLS